MMSTLVLIGLVLVPFAATAARRASSVRLDRSFGRTGWIKTPQGTGGAEGRIEVSVAPNGEPVVADLLAGEIFRLRADGGPQHRFGRRGYRSVGGSYPDAKHHYRIFAPRSMAVDRAGRVLIFGRQVDLARAVEVPLSPQPVPSSVAEVLRLDRSGRPDPSFGGGKGYVLDDLGLQSELSSEVPLVGALAGSVDSRGRPIFLAGVASQAGPCIGRTRVEEVPKGVVRLTSGGALDDSFGTSGISAIEGNTDFPQLQISGEDQLAIGAGPTADDQARCRVGELIYRLGRNGERSTRFGSEGALSLHRMQLAALEPSGAVIASGLRSHDLLLSRFSPTGLRDGEFGHDGSARVRLPRVAGLKISSVLVQKGGGIVVVGFSEGDASSKEPASFLVARLSHDGKMDPNVGVDGWVRTDFPPALELSSAQGKLDQQGRLVVAGTASTSKTEDAGFLVARYVLSK
jgi:uncharacterized delta-60 repeat protein